MSPRAPSVGLISLGCPKNLVDTEVIAGLIQKEGFCLAPTPDQCDIALINTCAFIQDAKEESLGSIRDLIQKKRKGDIRKIVVVGCLPQKYGREIRAELKDIDAFLGTGEILKVPEVLKSVLEDQIVFEAGYPQYLYDSETPRTRLTLTHSRYLKIAEGCSHHCSFCMIPGIRGKYRSRSIASILEEARQLAAEGAKEINLIAQDLTYFGMDTEGKLLLPKLIRELDGVSGIQWIRLLYSYPSFINEELLSAISDSRLVCRYLDVPLQHASDKILSRMKRGMTQAKMRDLVLKLRKRIPDLALRTTFIVGFPGETADDFKELKTFIEEMCFDHVGVFSYSDEPSLESYSLEGKLPDLVKEARRSEILLTQQKISREIHQALEGKRMQALIDAISPDGILLGRTYRDAPDIDGKVIIKAKVPVKPGDFVEVKVTRGLEYDLEGELSET